MVTAVLREGVSAFGDVEVALRSLAEVSIETCMGFWSIYVVVS